MIGKFLLDFLDTSLPSFRLPWGGTQRRTVPVKSHRRNGRRVKAHTREIDVPVVQQTTNVSENEYVKITRTRDRLNLPKGARITYAPRFATEYSDGNNSWATAYEDGSIDIETIEFKKRRR